jgi:hypothetical protein
MTKRVLADNRHETLIEGWPGHHSFLCEMLVYTGEYVYSRLGCREVRHQRTACVDRGAPHCSFIIEWK